MLDLILSKCELIFLVMGVNNEKQSCKKKNKIQGKFADICGGLLLS